MAERAYKSGGISGSFVVVFITAPSSASAEKISRGLLDAKLAACAGMIKGVRSLFWWEGKVNKANEVLIICKTRKSLIAELTKYVRRHHEYQIPEIIAVPIVGGNPDYLNWVKESTVE